MKESITKITMAVTLALAGMSHNACADNNAQTVTSTVMASKTSTESSLEEVLKKIREVTSEGRSLYMQLDELAEKDYESAELVANELRENAIGALAIAEYLFQALPSTAVIQSLDRDSLQYKLCRAVAELRHGVKNLDSLIHQILSVSPEHCSDINGEALASLAANGTRAAAKWL